MSMLFSRTATIPVWLVVFGLFALFGSPMTFATGVVLLLTAGKEVRGTKGGILEEAVKMA